MRVGFCGIVLLAVGCMDDGGGAALSPEAQARQRAELIATPAPVDAAVPTHEVRFASDFFLTSPAQAAPPDGRLGSGDRVHLLDRAGGFSRVRDAAGREMWIATDSLRELPSNQQAPITPPTTPEPHAD